MDSEHIARIGRARGFTARDDGNPYRPWMVYTADGTPDGLWADTEGEAWQKWAVLHESAHDGKRPTIGALFMRNAGTAALIFFVLITTASLGYWLGVLDYRNAFSLSFCSVPILLFMALVLAMVEESERNGQ